VIDVTIVSATPYNESMNAPIVAQKTGVQISLELTELGMQMVAAKHTREHPDATEAQVAARVRAWLHCEHAT
jgi:Rv0078B-related antitoxin